MSIGKIGFVELPQAKELQVATRLLTQPSLMEDGKIVIREMRINGGLSPDVALIEASTNTPVQFYDGEGEVTEIFYATTNNKPIGVILMSPEGEISIQVYNPKTDGGQRGYTVRKGYTMQTIIPEETTLTFLDYWSKRGFADKLRIPERIFPILQGNILFPNLKKVMYGEKVLKVVTDERVLNMFKEAELELRGYLESIS